MSTVSEIQNALSQSLPKELYSTAQLLAETIYALDVGKINTYDAEKILHDDENSSKALRILSGQRVRTASSLISFGKENNVGDVFINDVAGGNIIKIHVNIDRTQYTKHESPNNITLVVNGLLLILAAITTWYFFFYDVQVSNAIRLEEAYSGDKCFLYVGEKYFKNTAHGSMNYFGKVSSVNDLENYNYVYPTVTVNVVSLGKREQVKIAPYLLVSIVSITPISENSIYHEVSGTCGAAGYPAHFQAFLSNSQMPVSGAPHMDGSGWIDSHQEGQKYMVGHFLLNEGEHELFIVHIESEPGYVYQFRIGVPFSYREQQSIKWTDSTYTILSPSAIEQWHLDGTLTFNGNASKIMQESDILSSIQELRRLWQVYDNGAFTTPDEVMK